MESIYSAFLMLVRTISPRIMSIELSYGSYNIISTYEPLLRNVATVAVLFGIFATYVWAYRRISKARDDRQRLIYVIFAACACLVAVISLGKVSNSQYLVWLIPIGALGSALSAGDGRWRLVIACALAQAVYPFLYTTIIAGRLIPSTASSSWLEIFRFGVGFSRLQRPHSQFSHLRQSVCDGDGLSAAGDREYASLTPDS